MVTDLVSPCEEHCSVKDNRILMQEHIKKKKR